MPGLSIRAAFVALLAVVALPSSTLSEDANSPLGYSASPPEVVVVTGHRPGAEHLDTVVWNYVYAHGKLSDKIGQVTRWRAPVCPEVRNLPPAFDAFIKARIKAIAASVGAPVKEPCRINVEVIFSAEPQAIMDRVAESDPVLLGYHFVHTKAHCLEVFQREVRRT